MAALGNSRQANQSTHQQSREEPKLTLPSNAKHAQGHERKANGGMTTDK